jgi:hypothetical protein
VNPSLRTAIRIGIKVLAVLLIGLPVWFASVIGAWAFGYSISETGDLSDSAMDRIALANFLGLLLGAPLVYISGRKEDFGLALLTIGGIITTPIFAFTVMAVLALWQLPLPSEPPLTNGIELSRDSMVISFALGLLSSLLLYGLGRRARSKNGYQSSSHLSTESNMSDVNSNWILPAAGWGIAVAFGTFCGILVGLYTSSKLIQLFLAVMAALAAGAFAIRQLKR